MNPLPQEPSLRDITPEAKSFLAAAKFPQGPFDPAGAGKQAWAIWLRLGDDANGLLLLEKKPRQDGTFDLSVDWKVRQSARSFQHLLASMHCAADGLATPMSWQAQSRILDHSGNPIKDLTVNKDVKVNDGVFELSGGRRRFADNPLKTWTSNWSLMEAIPRLGGQQAKPLNFTMLDFLDERKDQQVLTQIGTLSITLGGRAAQLQGYQLVGRGILPMEYWLDEHGRLLILLGHERCLLAIDEDSVPEAISKLQGERA